MQKIFVYLHFFTTFALTYKLVGDLGYFTEGLYLHLLTAIHYCSPILTDINPNKKHVTSNIYRPCWLYEGKLNKQGKTIFRRKRVFDSQGNVIGEFAQESYVVENPRDGKKNPPTGAEKANIDSWRMACQRAKTEMAGLDCFIRATIYRTLMQNNS